MCARFFLRLLNKTSFFKFCRVMPTRCHKIREHTHRRRHHRHHINTMEIINELAQVDRQVAAEQAVVQAAMQIITID